MEGNPRIKDWIKAFRLRTLPLAFSCILTGSAIAYSYKGFDYIILMLALTTTLFLQVLSNLANDYGDFLKGTDNQDRVGPERAMQSGSISKSQMKVAMIIFVFLCFFSGVSLVLYAGRDISIGYPISFILLGLLSIVASIKYTAGKGAYGYKGLGDLFVFIFFGLVGVIGTCVLHLRFFELKMILPAISIGLFSSAVLNLNNMRDWENDKASGKYTLVVKLGLARAKVYHQSIILIGMLSSIGFVIQNDFKMINLLFLIAFVPLLIHLKKVRSIRNESPKSFDPELKKVALTTFLFSILFWLSIAQ